MAQALLPTCMPAAPRLPLRTRSGIGARWVEMILDPADKSACAMAIVAGTLKADDGDHSMPPASLALNARTRLRDQLLDRRSRLRSNVRTDRESADLVRLLHEVDAALSRLDGDHGDHYGACVACEGDVEPSDLMANPMASYCLCDLSPERQRALERDLDLAWRVQAALLPPLGLAAPGWESYYRYVPQGAVSGDYCDLVTGGDGGFYFMVGDVSGKGVAASLLMAHLNAALRAFAQTGLPPHAVLDKANTLLEESALTTHYATLVCGRATASGEVEIANGGHCPPVLVRADGSVKAIDAGGFPLGLAIPGTRSRYTAERLELDAGDCLVLYTDGLTEAANANDEEYSSERLVELLAHSPERSPRSVVTNCLEDLSSFVGRNPLSDDLTILALSRN